MCGTWFSQKPTGPNLAMPATSTVTNVTHGQRQRHAKRPVGEPTQGIMPNRLQPRTKKNIVHSNGTNWSAS